MSKFLLLLGPSGVGKSTIIGALTKLDHRFTYISPYMTRPLRTGETSKVSISEAAMDTMAQQGEFLVVNEIYGIRYATPRLPIVVALRDGQFPVLDWPVDRMKVMTQAFPGQLHIVYVLPPSIEILAERLKRDQRDTEGKRLEAALAELATYYSGLYQGQINLEVVSVEGGQDEAAKKIYSSYLQSF